MDELFALTWVHDLRFGSMDYRLRAVSGVVRSYRRRPTRYLVQIEVRWGYDRPFHRFDEMLAAFEARTDVDHLRGWKRSEIISKRDSVLGGLPSKTYLMRGAADSKPTFELIEPLMHTVANQWTGSYDVAIDEGQRAALALKEKLNQGWSPMLATGSQRYLRTAPHRLMNQMVFDKLASNNWPVPKREDELDAA